MAFLSALIFLLAISLITVFVVAQLVDKTPETRPITVKVEPKKTDWYEHGPWQVVSDGERICVRHGLGEPMYVWINKSMWGSELDYVTPHAPQGRQRLDHSWVRKPRVDDLPTIRKHCADRNEKLVEVAEEQARHDAWLEMNQTVI